jgi:hypothetical protein
MLTVRKSTLQLMVSKKVHCSNSASRHTNMSQNFFPTVVQTLGFSKLITLVLTCPPYLIAGAVTIAVSWSSGKFNERTWHITISKCVAVVGFLVASAPISVAGRYTAMVIFTIGTYGVNSLILGWCGSTCGQTPEKKAVAIGIVTTVMNASFIWYVAHNHTTYPFITKYAHNLTIHFPGLHTYGPNPTNRATSLH